MKQLKSILFLGLFFANILCAKDPMGYWEQIDHKSGKPQSIIGIYEYKGKYYGRILASFNESGVIDDSLDSPKDKATGVVGHPYYSGLDFMWDLEHDNGKYTDGEILDPRNGDVYNAEMWLDGDNLIVRGELLFIGVNQTWKPASQKDLSAFTPPDLQKLVPKIPKPI